VDVIVRTKAPQIANPPITYRVILVCEACQGPTPHNFVITRRAGLAFEQVYACSCCKTERRFGLLT